MEFRDSFDCKSQAPFDTHWRECGTGMASIEIVNVGGGRWSGYFIYAS